MVRVVRDEHDGHATILRLKDVLEHHAGLLDFINVPFFRDGEPSVSLSPMILERSNISESCCDRHHLAGEFRGQLPHCYQRGAQLAAERAPTP